MVILKYIKQLVAGIGVLEWHTFFRYLFYAQGHLKMALVYKLIEEWTIICVDKKKIKIYEYPSFMLVL